MKGMWTKRFASDGTPFYYNATQNRSVWKPPVDGIVLEAEQLKRRIDQDATALEAGEVETQDSVEKIIFVR
jgi:hypothetical protein